MDYVIGQSFQGARGKFVLLFEDDAAIKEHTGYFLTKVEIKSYSFMIDDRSFFDRLIENSMRT